MSAAPAAALTFGCRLNIVESEAMRRAAAEGGLPDAILVNTCAVTGEAVRQARQAIRRAAREHPGAPIVVGGCAAQIDPPGFAGIDGVTQVVGNSAKTDPATYARIARALAEGETPARVAVGAPDGVARLAPEGGGGRTRAFLQAQTGCDHRCTFCVIPFGRGRSRSVPAGRLIADARRLVAAGAPEIVLTGVDLTAWGADLPGAPRLGRLARDLLAAVPDLPRLRLSSIDSVEADDDLLVALAEEERLAPHLHLSLQSGDDLILKRMRRRHSRADAIAFCERARRLRPDVVFGADLIAGFPTETEAMFSRSLALIEDCGLTHLHVFPYSPRPGTPAARMPPVAGEATRARAARLRAAGEAALARHLDRQIGRTLRGLVERGGLARSADFTAIDARGATPGEFRDFDVAAHDGRKLIPSSRRPAIPRAYVGEPAP